MKNVVIYDVSTGSKVMEYPVVAQGQNYDISDDYYHKEAYSLLVSDGLANGKQFSDFKYVVTSQISLTRFYTLQYSLYIQISHNLYYVKLQNNEYECKFSDTSLDGFDHMHNTVYKYSIRERPH